MQCVGDRSKKNWSRMAEVEKQVSSAVDEQIQLKTIQEEGQLELGTCCSRPRPLIPSSWRVGADTTAALLRFLSVSDPEALCKKQYMQHASMHNIYVVFDM